MHTLVSHLIQVQLCIGLYTCIAYTVQGDYIASILEVFPISCLGYCSVWTTGPSNYSLHAVSVCAWLDVRVYMYVEGFKVHEGPMLNQDHEEKYMLIKSTQPNMKLTTFCLISKPFNVNSLVCKNGYQVFFYKVYYIWATSVMEHKGMWVCWNRIICIVYTSVLMVVELEESG